MWQYNVRYAPNELYHYGVLGMKWGVRKKEETNPRKKGRRDVGSSSGSGSRYVQRSQQNIQYAQTQYGNKSRMSERQKRLLKVGLVIAGLSLAAIGGYALAKSGKLDDLAKIGKQKVGNAEGILNTGFKKMDKPELLADSLKNANPLKRTLEGKNNCINSSIAGFLRSKGYDVTAKGSGGVMQNPGGVIEECFKGAKIVEGSAVKFGKSKKDAAEMLVKRFGDNAEGVCAIDWANGKGGHCFSWKITNKNVLFSDYSMGFDDDKVGLYFNEIKKTGSLTIARLDQAELNLEALSKYVESR